MNRAIATLLLPLSMALLLAGSLGGCAQLPWTSEPKHPFGEAVKETVASQILSPGEPSNAPVEGLDGVRATRIYRDYREGKAKSDSTATKGILLNVGKQDSEGGK